MMVHRIDCCCTILTMCACIQYITRNTKNCSGYVGIHMIIITLERLVQPDFEPDAVPNPTSGLPNDSVHSDDSAHWY